MADAPRCKLTEGDLNNSSARQTWTNQEIAGPARDWLEQDAAVFLHQSLSTPCLNVLGRCAGAEIEDLTGRTLLDFHGNYVHQVGFGHPEVIKAIVAQLHELSFCTRRYTNLPAIQLAQKLIELAPAPLRRVLFAPGGTSAIGIAIKLARVATGRFKMVSTWDSFHGASLDGISVGGEALFRSGIGPLLPGCEHVPPPDHRHCPFHCGTACNLRCADYIEYVLEKEGDVAAVIAETIRCTPLIPPPDYWKRVRAACDRHGALLILDEIPTCLGRTGKMFACEHYGIAPDILVIGKGLGGGIFPLAAVLAREELNVAGHTALGHYTHEKNPVAAAAAMAAIRVIEQENLLAETNRKGDWLMAALKNLQPRHPIIAEVRGIGLLVGVELMAPGQTADDAARAAEEVMYAALTRGLSFKVTMGNILTLVPALTVSDEQLRRAVEILDASLHEVSKRKPGDQGVDRRAR